MSTSQKLFSKAPLTQDERVKQFETKRADAFL